MPLLKEGKFKNYHLPGFMSWIFQLLLLTRQTRTLLHDDQCYLQKGIFIIFCMFSVSLAWQWPCGYSGEAKNNYCCARWRGAAGDLHWPYGECLNVCKCIANLCVTKAIWGWFMCVQVQCVTIYLAARLGTCLCIKPGPLHNTRSLKLCSGYKMSRIV